MGFAVAILKPACLLFTRKTTSGVPLPSGGVILAVNHISHADPIVVSDFVLYDARRVPRFMAKSTLFRGNGLVARVMRGADQIPVVRNAPDASRALDAAVEALARGELIVIYPEGTVSRDPQKWPMRARTGVARLALLSGAPVIPLAQWGAQEILDTYRTKGFHPLPRHAVQLRSGPPVDLTAWVGRELTGEVLRAATEAVMDAITDELEVLRGSAAPTERFDRDAARTADQQQQHRRSA